MCVMYDVCVMCAVWCVLGMCVCGVCWVRVDCVGCVWCVLCKTGRSRLSSVGFKFMDTGSILFLCSRNHKTYAISCGRFARSNGRLKTGTPSCRYFCKPKSLSSVSTIVQYI